MVMRSKRAQRVTTNSLVGIILLLILFYIIFLPPGEREALLEGDNSDLDGKGDVSENATLLREFPGTMSYLSKKEIKKEIPNVFLIETTNSKELERFNPFYVRNGVLDDKPKTLEFDIDDLKVTNNVRIAFVVKKAKGILTIKLNDEIIYENEITTINIEPIELK